MDLSSDIPPPTEKEQALMDKLSNRELDLLRERTKRQAMMTCDDVVRKFVDCTKPRFISAIWACRGELHDMNDCVLKKYALLFSFPSSFYFISSIHFAFPSSSLSLL